MKTKGKILVWLSWWVDSAVTAYLLKKEWYDVTAGFMINYLDEENPHCPTRDDIKIAKEVAEYLEIPFFTFDYRDEYEKKVLNYMYSGYRKGITPNPDIMCNSEVKFRLFLEEAIELWFAKIATGHYAIVKDGRLFKWIDTNKDQSYFLAGVSREQFLNVLFPIWNLEKSEVRKIAREAWLPNAERKDSQWICFVGKVNMMEFLEKKIQPVSWRVLDTSWRVLWEHRGVFYYTIGQRKGLDIWGQKKAIFVIRKDLEKNEIIVGTQDDIELYWKRLFMNHINILNESIVHSIDNQWEQEIYCKIRYRQKDQKCKVFKEKNWRYRVEFAEKQRAIAAGQICAIYLQNELVMSWVIE